MEASLERPLWVAIRRGKAAHALVDETMRTACGLNLDQASASTVVKCSRCLLVLKMRRAAAKKAADA